jgi:hypothetical protein
MHPAAEHLALGGLYALGAIAAALAAARARGRERLTWLSAALVLAGLLAAKELHAMDGLTRAARATVVAGGWYGERREAQGVFAVVLLAIALAVAVVLARWLRTAPVRAKTAAAAILFLLGFVILRTASLHAVDQWAGKMIGGIRLASWTEGAAVLATCVAAIGAARAPKT